MLVAPSPKVQAQEAGLLAEESVKLTVCPTAGELGEKLKAATGTEDDDIGVYARVMDAELIISEEIAAVRVLPVTCAGLDGSDGAPDRA